MGIFFTSSTYDRKLINKLHTDFQKFKRQVPHGRS